MSDYVGLTRPRSAQIDTTEKMISDPVVAINYKATGKISTDVGFMLNRGVDLNIALIWRETDNSLCAFKTTSPQTTNTNIQNAGWADLKVGQVTVNGSYTLPASAGDINSILAMTAQGLAFTSAADIINSAVNEVFVDAFGDPLI